MASLEKVIKDLEYENEDLIRQIKDEIEKINGIQKDTTEKIKEHSSLEQKIEKSNEETKSFHEKFKQNKDIIESLNNAHSLLLRHSTDLENTIKLKNEEIQIQRQEHEKWIDSYKERWKSYQAEYEKRPLAQVARKLKLEAANLDSEEKKLLQKEEELQKEINKYNYHKILRKKQEVEAIQCITELAKMKLSTRSVVNQIREVEKKRREKQEVLSQQLQQLEDIKQKRRALGAQEKENEAFKDNSKIPLSKDNLTNHESQGSYSRTVTEKTCNKELPKFQVTKMSFGRTFQMPKLPQFSLPKLPQIPKFTSSQSVTSPKGQKTEPTVFVNDVHTGQQQKENTGLQKQQSQSQQQQQYHQQQQHFKQQKDHREYQQNAQEQPTSPEQQQENGQQDENNAPEDQPMDVEDEVYLVPMDQTTNEFFNTKPSTSKSQPGTPINSKFIFSPGKHVEKLKQLKQSPTDSYVCSGRPMFQNNVDETSMDSDSNEFASSFNSHNQFMGYVQDEKGTGAKDCGEETNVASSAVFAVPGTSPVSLKVKQLDGLIKQKFLFEKKETSDSFSFDVPTAPSTSFQFSSNMSGTDSPSQFDFTASPFQKDSKNARTNCSFGASSDFNFTAGVSADESDSSVFDFTIGKKANEDSAPLFNFSQSANGSNAGFSFEMKASPVSSIGNNPFQFTF